MAVVRQHALIVCEGREKSESPDAVGGDSVTVNNDGTAQKLAEIFPVEIPAVLEFPHQPRGIEGVSRLPELQHHKAADESMVERPCSEYAEIVDVACVVPLIAGADFFGKDFSERQACQIRRRKRQESKIALINLGPALCRQRRRLAPADLKPDFAFTLVPVVRIHWIDTPGQTVLRLVITRIRHRKLNPVKRLFEGLHHGEDYVFMIVLLDAGEVQIGREPSWVSKKHFPKTRA